MKKKSSRRDIARFEVLALSRATLTAGLMRGELRKKAGISAGAAADAFAGRPVGVRVVRSIAAALGRPIGELLETVEVRKGEKR